MNSKPKTFLKLDLYLCVFIVFNTNNLISENGLIAYGFWHVQKIAKSNT